MSYFGTNLKKKTRRCINLALSFVTMHEQPYPLAHYSGIGNFHTTHRFLKVNSSTPLELTWIADSLDLPVPSQLWTFRQFPKSPRHSLTRCTLTAPSTHSYIKWRWKLMEQIRFAHKNWITLRNFSWTKFRFYLHCTSTYPPNSICLTLAPAVECYLLLQSPILF